MKSRIDYHYAHFDFNYIWLRDKQIVLQGDKYMGMLIILDSKGNALKWYGYEMIDDDEDEQN
jgi:hypothetical protein